LVLAAQDRRDGGGGTAQHLVLHVDHHPVARGGALAAHESRHEKAPKGAGYVREKNRPVNPSSSEGKASVTLAKRYTQLADGDVIRQRLPRRCLRGTERPRAGERALARCRGPVPPAALGPAPAVAARGRRIGPQAP